MVQGRLVAGVAGRGRRNVDVVDGQRSGAEVDLDTEEFEVWVTLSRGRRLEARDDEGVVDEEEEATSSALAVLADESVGRNGRGVLLVGLKLALLDGGDVDAFFCQELSQFVDSVLDAVAVELKDVDVLLSERGRSVVWVAGGVVGSRMRVYARDEEEDEDEETGGRSSGCWPTPRQKHQSRAEIGWEEMMWSICFPRCPGER